MTTVKPSHTPPRSIRIPTDLWEAAKAEAAERGETVTDAITRFLQRYADFRRPEMHTLTDVEQMVHQSLESAPGYPDDYDIEAIARELVDAHGLDGALDTEHDEYWSVVACHDRTQTEETGR